MSIRRAAIRKTGFSKHGSPAESRNPFGCITVLNKQNVSHSAQIFEFFRRAGISFRLLPVFRGTTETQNDEYSLAPVQVLDAFKQYFDLWINS